ncbi:hypothetical protein JB92DRAFT_3146629 [Gautieria morchelliformis]|nr:hypothetical protein JB92DRAFT_3146629 [Gautieria morchelliformis]
MREVEVTALESITGTGWFLYKIDNIVQTHYALQAAASPEAEGLIKTAKGQGFADRQTLVCADEATCDPPASGHVLRVWWTLERPAHTTSTQRIMHRHMTLDSMSMALWSLGAVFTDTDLEATKGTLHASASRRYAIVMHDWEEQSIPQVFVDPNSAGMRGQNASNVMMVKVDQETVVCRPSASIADRQGTRMMMARGADIYEISEPLSTLGAHRKADPFATTMFMAVIDDGFGPYRKRVSA